MLKEVKISSDIHHTMCVGCEHEGKPAEGCPTVQVEGESALECTHSLVDGRLKARMPKPGCTFIFVPDVKDKP